MDPSEIQDNSSCVVCDAIKQEKVLLHITGNDFPGVLSRLTKILTKWNVPLLDVQQTTSLGQMNLSLLVDIYAHAGLNVLKEINQLTRELNLHLDFFVLGEESGNEADDKNRKSFALTLLSKNLPIRSFHEIARELGDHNINIERINHLAHGDIQAIEFILAVYADSTGFKKLKRVLFEVAFANNFDLAIQPENLYRRSKRLIVMDMDSTLIQQEVIDEIAKAAGVEEKVSEITAKAMQGKLDFTESLHERVSLLKGLPETVLKDVLKNIQLTEGAEILVSILKKMGFKIAVISGGFTYFAGHLQKMLSLDYSFANELEIKDGFLTGKTTGVVVDRARKAELLKELAAQEKIPLDQTVAVGDGANDMDMLETAGLGIAFNAKPTVKKSAQAFISLPGLDSVLYLLGVSEKELKNMKEQEFKEK